MSEVVYCIYKVTNTINQKIYVGVHRTTNVDDDYLGSGKRIKAAIVKYGKDVFRKEILHIFNSKEEAYDREQEIVNENFIKNEKTYNLIPGGLGGFERINESVKPNHFKGKKHSEESRRKMSETQRIVQNRPEERERNRRNQIIAQNRPDRKAAKSKLMRELYTDSAIREKHRGACNTPEWKAAHSDRMFNTKWMVNPATAEKRSVKPEDIETYLSSGWLFGMKIKPERV